MGRANARDAGKAGWDPRTIGQLILAVCLILAIASINLGVRIPAKLSGDPVNAGIFDVVAYVVKGKIVISTFGYVIIGCLWAVSIAGGLLLLVRKGKNTNIRVDAAAEQLATKKDINSLSRSAAAAKAKKWIKDPALAEQYPGLRLGKIPGKKTPLYSTWEDLYLIIFGPRMGKTTTQVIPAIVDAPGAVLTTSNKRDIIDETGAIRKLKGEVFVFDPQKIAHGYPQQPWFFDPLDTIRLDEDTMDAAAMELADIFRCAAQGDTTGSDPFFSEGGRDLLGRLFLAAALDSRPISDVFLWVSNDKDKEPVRILARYPKWDIQAKGLNATYAITEKTRSGLFANAQQMAAPLSRVEAIKWVVATPGARRFNPAEFVRSKGDTLYVLSKEGADNAAALTTALTAAVMKAAEKYGEQCGGRLPVPLVAPLDEAANVVKWPQLPRLYSHYGSRSIILMTILQSYAQGVSVWGEEGMEALWSASAILMYGGGVRDERMLQKIEALIGEYEEWTTSVSHNQGVRSTSRSKQERKILTVAELAALGDNRALVLATKRRPVVAELEPFWKRTYWPAEIRELLPKEQ